jgi:hypothetical protein
VAELLTAFHDEGHRLAAARAGDKRMTFSAWSARGLNQVLPEAGLDPDALRIRISERAPGAISHAAHTRADAEGFCVLAGYAEIALRGDGPSRRNLLAAARSRCAR